MFHVFFNNIPCFIFNGHDGPNFTKSILEAPLKRFFQTPFMIFSIIFIYQLLTLLMLINLISPCFVDLMQVKNIVLLIFQTSKIKCFICDFFNPHLLVCDLSSSSVAGNSGRSMLQKTWIKIIFLCMIPLIILNIYYDPSTYLVQLPH